MTGIGRKAKKPDYECNSEMGITVGLIDSIITISRVLFARLDIDAMITGEHGDEYQPIRDALTDLCTNKALSTLINCHNAEAMDIIHRAAAIFRTRSAGEPKP